MKNAKYIFYLSGIEVNNPLDWQEIQVMSTFDNDAIQSNVSTSELTFPLASNTFIRKWVSDGLSNGVGIFEGIPLNIAVVNDDRQTIVGRYIIDFDTYTETEDRKVNVSFRFADGLNQISDRLEAITFGWLESTGKVKKSDYVKIPYVVRKEFDTYELVSLSITVAIMSKAAIDSISEIGDAFAIQGGMSGILPAGAVGGVIYKIASIIVALAKSLALLLAFKQLFQQILDAYIPVPRFHNVMTLQRMFEITCEYLGYTPDTNLPLSDHYYLPSNTSLDTSSIKGFISFGNGTKKGIPSSNDFGYALSEFMELIKRLFNGKFSVLDDVLYFRNVDDPFWVRDSTYSMRSDTFINETRYNTSDLKANQLFKFATDVTDTWTITNFKGTNYEVITRPKIFNIERNILLKGLNTIEIPLALGNKKTGLSAFDKFLLSIAKAMDAITKLFGGGSNYAGLIKAYQNCLMVTTNNHVVPKLLLLNSDGSMPTNHRNLLSAKTIYEDYYGTSSFVLNNNFGQKKLYTDVKVPFGYDDFLKLQANSYIKDFNGRVAKVTSLKWSVGADYALLDFWVREPYTKNLLEEYVEAE